jgi:hypothetical protein
VEAGGGQQVGAGWYPDPWAPGGLRWWDGNGWTSIVSAGGPPPQAQSTDGFAIAALVFGVIGGVLLAIIFGFVARSRIMKSGGLKTGKGMATAGIALGFVWLGLIAIFVTLGLTGVLDSENADDYSGVEREVALVVDRFEELADDEKTAEVCFELLTPEFSSSISDGGGKPCSAVLLDEIEDRRQAELDIESIRVTGNTAVLRVDEEGDKLTWHMVRRDGSWRVDGIE